MAVYFICDEQRTRMKIGYTHRPDAVQRLARLQTANADRLIVVRFIPDAGYAAERWFHQHYADHRINGEWFHYCATALTLPPPPLPPTEAVPRRRNRRRAEARAKAEWVADTFVDCTALAKACDRLTATIDFGRWCNANGFETMNHHDRAAAIKMGRDPAALRACLEATERRSLQQIYYHEFGQFATRNPREKAINRGRWTAAIDVRLLQLREEGHSYGAVAGMLVAEFGIAVNENICKQRAYQLGAPRQAAAPQVAPVIAMVAQ